jgi:hypothetical protein
MKILFLTYYFEPDLCAGSFRNTSLFKEVTAKLKPSDTIEVITTHPNRYDSYKVAADDFEKRTENISINRIKIPTHGNGLLGQIKSFRIFFFKAITITKNQEYDLVYASSSRLFTAFLGSKIARKKKAKLYLDIRDIFRESILDIFKNSIFKLGLDLFLRPIENYTFKKASHINLVSRGFESYFSKFKQCNYSFFTNGIDAVFLEKREVKKLEKSSCKTIVYAGNIGEGQGLHIIIPDIAKALRGAYKFVIFGDGGAKQKLVDALKLENIQNVTLHRPINRDLLIAEYQKADFLFLHLNKHKAFERVLPSKLFEYGAFDKPILAGVSGYAAQFVKAHMNNSIVFNPGDALALLKELEVYSYKNGYRKSFLENFSRKQINSEMALSITSL